MQELGEAELSRAMLAFLQLANPHLTVLAFWLARCHEKPSESCRKDVKKLSKTLSGGHALDALDCKKYFPFVLF